MIENDASFLVQFHAVSTGNGKRGKKNFILAQQVFLSSNFHQRSFVPNALVPA